MIQPTLHDLTNLLGSSGTEELSFNRCQIRDSGADEHRVAFEDHYVPETGCVVELQAAGEEAGKDVAEVGVGLGSDAVVCEEGVEAWGFALEGGEDQGVGSGCGT